MIEAIPMPVVMERGYFKNGVAANILRLYAENPFRFLDEVGAKKIRVVNAELLRKFSELAFEQASDVRWGESQPMEADEIDLGRIAEADAQGNLLETSDDPF